jgi:hypothetical protein
VQTVDILLTNVHRRRIAFVVISGSKQTNFEESGHKNNEESYEKISSKKSKKTAKKSSVQPATKVKRKPKK